MKKRPTKVVFLKFKRGGDIIALFPQEMGTVDHNTCLAYQHDGQHGTMDLRHRGMLVTATPPEYAGLKAELEGLGYNLVVFLNITNKDALIRYNKLKVD